jgi:hypothetical protein
MSELVIWSAASGAWLTCPAGEIVWLDRLLLSGGQDSTLHRPPRCPGLRHVHYRWELFSRDPSHPVYLAPFAAGTAPDHRAVQAAARQVLPPARGGLEAQPAILDGGAWAVSVGAWVLPVCVNVTPDDRARPAVPASDDLPGTREIDRRGGGSAAARPPLPDALARAARYLQRNPLAGLAMAYYYQDFIREAMAPQPQPLDSVVVALNLNKGAVSEYKKELQRRIWNEPGHQRELGAFLLGNGLIGPADLQRALDAAAANEAAGQTRVAQERLRYNQKQS